MPHGQCSSKRLREKQGSNDDFADELPGRTLTKKRVQLDAAKTSWKFSEEDSVAPLRGGQRRHNGGDERGKRIHGPSRKLQSKFEAWPRTEVTDIHSSTLNRPQESFGSLPDTIHFASGSTGKIQNPYQLAGIPASPPAEPEPLEVPDSPVQPEIPQNPDIFPPETPHEIEEPPPDVIPVPFREPPGNSEVVAIRGALEERFQ